MILATADLAWTVIRNEQSIAINGRTYKAQCSSDGNLHIQNYQSNKYQRFNIFNKSVWQTDLTRNPRPNRSELSAHNDAFGVADSMWFAYAMKVDPKSRSIVDAFVGQLHDFPGVGDNAYAPIYAHELIGTTFTIRSFSNINVPATVPPVEVIRYTKTLVYGTWYQFVIHLIPNPAGSGTIHVWIDGLPVINLTNAALGFASSTGLYWKYGIYDLSATTYRGVWFANMEAGTASLAARITAPLSVQ